MKKFFLLLLLAACVWGYYEGSVDNSAISAEPRAAQAASAGEETLSTRVLSGVSDLVQGLFENALRRDAEEASAPAPPSPANGTPSGEESFFDAARDVYDFQTALESRLDRTKFVPSENIPDLMKKALVATEDRRFYEHGAIDFIGVVRAAIVNYTAGGTVEGGSTISQQVVKNIFLSPERTVSRKLREVLLAVQLERYYTKDEILEIYLNTVYFGHGAYGLGEASETYFGKSPEALTTTECALLAGLPQAPSAYDPIEHPDAAKKRLTTVLMLMAREGYITPQEAAGAAFDVLLE